MSASLLEQDTDFLARAAAVLGGQGRRIGWPYGLETPAASAWRRDPAIFERRVRENDARRQILVAWAERYGLRRSPAGCCPLWLCREHSRRCTSPGPRPACSRARWMDHTVTWLKDSRPAVLTAAPYNVVSKDEEDLALWPRFDSRLRSAQGPGWYGYDTTQIILWRTDRIAEIAPAGPGA